VGRNDIDGYQFPPTYSIISKNNFPFWQFFTVFQVPKFQGHFKALNDGFLEFFGAMGCSKYSLNLGRIFTSRIDLSNEVLNAQNKDYMQKLRPREVDVSTTPIEPTNL
jgi:hypothetical protein